MSAWEERTLKAMEQIDFMQKEFSRVTEAHIQALKDIVTLATSLSSVVERVSQLDDGTVLADYDWAEVKAVISRYRNL